MPAYHDINTDTWFVKFRYHTPGGKTWNKTKRGFSSKQIASAWEHSFKAILTKGTGMTLNNFYEVYKEELFSQLKPGTRAKKETITKNMILPYLGETPLNRISCTDVVKWHDWLISRDYRKGIPFTADYLSTVHSQLSAMLNHAVKNYGLPNNVAKLVGNIWSTSDKHFSYWNREEFNQFIYEMMSDPDYYYIFMLLYLTGISKEELLTVNVSDFDFERNTLSVPILNDEQKVHKVPIPEAFSEELEYHLDAIPDRFKSEWPFKGFSIPLISRALRAGARRTGLSPIRINDLRHSSVARWIEMGYSASAIAGFLGCETAYVSSKYSKLFEARINETR